MPLQQLRKKLLMDWAFAALQFGELVFIVID